MFCGGFLFSLLFNPIYLPPYRRCRRSLWWQIPRLYKLQSLHQKPCPTTCRWKTVLSLVSCWAYGCIQSFSCSGIRGKNSASLFLVAIIGTLFFRAWSKILNFSDDQVGRPEKAAVLWKWLIERLRKSKKEKPPGQHLHVSSFSTVFENHLKCRIFQKLAKLTIFGISN